MTDETKWEMFDKDALVVEYTKQRRQRLQNAIGEFLSDDDAKVEEMLEIIKTEIQEWTDIYQKAHSKCLEAKEGLKQI